MAPDISQHGPFEQRPSWPLPLERSIKISSFLDLGVSAAVAKRLDSLGITTPLPIQAATITEALAGRDICGQAPTGSGKTLAFGIPLVQAVSASTSRLPRGLVLVPTRELADQVRDVLSSLMIGGSNRVVALYGGTGYKGQRQALRRGVDIIVACPGRLEDLIAQGDVRLEEVSFVVLDEADRMVDMGFVKPVHRLLDQTAKGRQILLFSATIGTEVTAISRRYQSQPSRHQVQLEKADAAHVTHLFWRTAHPERVGITARLIERHGQAFVFCRTKRGVDRVARQLKAAGVDASPIHGDRTQPQRTRALAAFANKRTHALVTTDVMARGIHIDDVPCVVHFDPPSDAESYIHRSGRTGRSGNLGTVISLVADDVQNDVRALQRALGFEKGFTTPFQESPTPPARSSTSTKATDSGRPTSAERMTGRVKTYDPKRGFGFLSTPEGADVFVHHSMVQSEQSGRGTLRKGGQVTFEVVAGRRGQEARNVIASVRAAT